MNDCTLAYCSTSDNCSTIRALVTVVSFRSGTISHAQTRSCSGVRRGGRRGCWRLDVVQPQRGQRPPVATPSLTLNRDKVRDRQPGEAHLQVRRRFRTRRSTATTGSSCTCSIRAASSCGPTTTCRRRRPRQWKPGQTDRVHAHRVRAELSLHRRSGSPVGALQPVDRQAPDAERAGGVRARNTWSRSSSCCRSRRTSSLSTRTAGTRRKWPRTTRRPSGSGPRKPPRISFSNPKKDATFYLEFDARTDLFKPPQQVPSAWAIRSIGDLRRRQQGRKLLDLSDHRGAVRRRRHGGARHRRGPDVQPGRRRCARSRDPGLSRLHRAEISRLAPSPKALHLRAFFGLQMSSTVVFLDICPPRW